MDKWIVVEKDKCKHIKHPKIPACLMCEMSKTMKGSWRIHLSLEFEKPYLKRIVSSLMLQKFYPSPEKILYALSFFEVEESKVVILGQDPYHGPGQAMGLAFSVPPGIRIPPSLRNIYKEIDKTIGYPRGIPSHGSLIGWAKQGVLLLNTTLTVAPSLPGSHSKLYWCTFTDEVIKLVSHLTRGTVFILWGMDASKKAVLIDGEKHLVLKSPHPSPLSALKGFFGCNHFNLANEFLVKQGKTPIDWTGTNDEASE